MGKSKIYIIGILSMILCSFTNALELKVPSPNNSKDIALQTSVVSQQQAQEETLTNLINLINENLWFIVGLVGLLLLAYAGFKIITAQGDKEKISRSYNLIIAAFIMIFMSILSYVIVKLIVNLF